MSQNKQILIKKIQEEIADLKNEFMNVESRITCCSGDKENACLVQTRTDLLDQIEELQKQLHELMKNE